MAKCLRCGKSTIVRGHVALADGAVCTPCFRKLGFKLSDSAMASVYKYDEIKDGRDVYHAKHTIKKSVLQDIKDRRIGFSVANHGQDRELICTEEERKIYENIVEIIADALLDPSVLRLSRKSDNYVSAVMDSSGDYGAMDVARIKFTNRAKWIQIGPGFEKTTIRTPEDVFDHRQDVIDAYRFNEPYL